MEFIKFIKWKVYKVERLEKLERFWICDSRFVICDFSELLNPKNLKCQTPNIKVKG